MNTRNLNSPVAYRLSNIPNQPQDAKMALAVYRYLMNILKQLTDIELYRLSHTILGPLLKANTNISRTINNYKRRGGGKRSGQSLAAKRQIVNNTISNSGFTVSESLKRKVNSHFLGNNSPYTKSGINIRPLDVLIYLRHI